MILIFFVHDFLIQPLAKFSMLNVSRYNEDGKFGDM